MDSRQFTTGADYADEGENDEENKAARASKAMTVNQEAGHEK